MQKALLFALGLVFISFSSCSKGGDDGDADCENDNTCTVTVTNTGTQPLKVDIAVQLTPQYEAIDPVLTMTLAAGQTAKKTIAADRYFIVWWNNCATSCNRLTSYAKTYENCSTTEEKQGL